MSSDTRGSTNRVWTNPDSEEGKPSLICLKPDELCLAVVSVDDLDRVSTSLAEGKEVIALVAQNIPLKAILQLQGDEGDNDLSITYKEGVGTTDSVTLTITDSSRRDEFLEALRERLGPGWKCERKQTGRLSAALWPLGVTAGIALLTWFMYGEAKEIAAGEHLKPLGRKAKTKLVTQVMHWVEGQIGATGILLLGVLLAALCLLWLVYAIARPPTRLTLRPEET